MPKIRELYAYVAVENEPDDEGIIAVLMPAVPPSDIPTMMPLVGADMARMKSLAPLVQKTLDIRKVRVRLKRFILKEVIE